MAHSICDESPSRVVFGALLLWAVAWGVAPTRASEAEWHVSMGPGLVISPEYPGSEDERVLPIPALDIRYHSLFLDWRRGLGGYLVHDERQQLGASVWLRRGRDGDAPSAVAALEDIDDSAIAPRWTLTAFAGLDVLIGAAADSPFTERTSLPTLGLGAFYHYDP